MQPDTDARLRAHVAAILARGGLPATDRDDVAAELLGHLAERTAAHREAGASEDEAVARAIVEFGGARELGRDFQATYHSRLWASTIGVLLPVTAPEAGIPSVVTWIRRAAIAIAVLTLFAGTVTALILPPGRALIFGLATLAGATCILLAAEGLRRRQRWARGALTVTMFAQTIVFLVSLLPANGAIHISFNGFLGLVFLVHILRNEAALDAWVAGSDGIPVRLGAVVGVALGTWAVVPLVLTSIPDPTQLGPRDIRIVASADCSFDGDRLTLVETTVDVTWLRTELWPGGLARASDDRTDAVSIEPGEPYGGVLVVDPATGAVLPNDFRSGPMPSGMDPERVLADLPASEMRPGRTIRITTAADSDSADLWPLVQVRYAHLDRFILSANVRCGETAPVDNVDVVQPGHG